MNRFLIILLLLFVYGISYSQSLTQNIRGQVIEATTLEPIPFATILILGTSPPVGTTTDIDGNYILEEVPLGRYDLQFSFIGYNPVIVPELILTSAKEVVLDVQLNESSHILDEIVVKPEILKQKPLSQMASVSARMLSVEEASRYAGGFDDPARLASAFPGVATSTVGSNAIIIRGNAPKYLSWNIEGVEIPNPNHFANLGVFGGGGLTALSNNLMANSDFLTGAFPADHNNALSGVFDLRMRNGNNSNYEHSFELGLLGVDFAAEGPINKSKGSSYLFNYRYSTLGLLSSFIPDDTGINYQDLSFKINLPSKKYGLFSIWGIGLYDRNTSTYQEDISKRKYISDFENTDATLSMGATGINHKKILNNSSYINSTLAFSMNEINFVTNRLDQSENLHPLNQIRNRSSVVTLQSFINKRFSPAHRNQTGVKMRIMNYDLKLQEAQILGSEPTELVDESGRSNLMSFYSNSSLTKKDFTTNFGVSGQYLTLNKEFIIEPRLGLTYKLNDKHSLSIGYGMHSRLEPLQTYFANTAPSLQGNKNLKLAKAHHFVFAYDWDCTDKLHLKIEPYFQYLFDVPIVAGTNLSILNNHDDWFVTDSYINDGVGMNYGIDLTIEQYINNGFYYLISGSVFNSRFKNSTEWYNTRYNKNFLANLLVGKEFRVGKAKQNLLGFNAKLSYQGGDRFSRINISNSDLLQEVVFDESTPFNQQFNPAFLTSFTLNFEWYRTRLTHRLSLKVINATGFQEYIGHDYNLLSSKSDAVREAIIIPNLSYKIMF